MAIKAGPLFAAGGGVLLLWSGLTGRSWSTVLKDLVSGKNPAASPVKNPITGTPATALQANTDSSFANDFLNYVGRVPYKWAGASPITGWDCSGSVNYVVCHDSNHAIPGYKGGTFTGNTHGPPTGVWLGWCAAGNAQRLSASMCTAGIIVIWQTHMGIAISNTQYVSAYDTQDGTCVKPIHGGGPVGEVATFWRLK